MCFGEFLELEESFFTVLDAGRTELDDVTYTDFLILCFRHHITQLAYPFGVNLEIIDVVGGHRL